MSASREDLISELIELGATTIRHGGLELHIQFANPVCPKCGGAFMYAITFEGAVKICPNGCIRPEVTSKHVTL